MRHIDPKNHPVQFVHRLLLSGVAPRPIALVSSMDAEGRCNLAPFSYYNAFGANPPIIAVSPAYRGTDATPKHTFLNIVQTKEFTVSAVSYAMAQQASLASSDYDSGVNEFDKAGFTPLLSRCVAPPGVAESPFLMECRLLQRLDLGISPGGGNILIGEILMFHIRESAFENDAIDPRRMDLVARLGQDWYCRASGDALFRLQKPRHAGIGFDALPDHVRLSPLLTGNDLGILAGAASLPEADTVRDKWLRDLLRMRPGQDGPDIFEVEIATENARNALFIVFGLILSDAPVEEISHRLQITTKAFLSENNIERAWECALMSNPAEVEKIRHLLRTS